MEKNTILQGDDVLLIKKTSLKRKYQTETEGFKDKYYLIYAYGDKAFAVHEDDQFNEDFAKGDIQKVMVVESAEGWSLSNHISWTRANAQKRNQAMNEAITVEMFKPAAVSADLLNAIG